MFRATAVAITILAGAGMAGLGACATSEQDLPATAAMSAGAASLESALVNNAGTEIGRVQFMPAPTGVLIRVLVSAGGLSPGWHGTHLHMTGDCSGTAKFEHAGGHIRMNRTNHGLLYPHGPETGDLPNLSVASDGSAAAELFTNLISLAEMQDADGSAFVIHANPDDHMSQPTGDSGDRRACAAVRR